MTNAILGPVAALMALTFAVWVFMYVLRVRYIIANKVPDHNLSSPELLNATLPERINRPSNNLKNLFELPVIFYVLCLALLVTQRTDDLFVNLAWTYVALRTLHSAIHCTLNLVPLRFAAYLLSSIVLWVMVFRFAHGVL